MFYRRLFKFSSTLLLIFVGLLASQNKVEAKKDCNRLFPEPWQFPDRQRCHAENKGAELAEESWGEAGRGIYTSAAAIMSKRSPTGTSLDSSLKNALHPYFGGLVDRVTIHWGTPGLDTWADSRYGIRLSDTDSAGQTYGHDIYIAQQKPSSYNLSLVHLITHELVHSEQYERYGSSLSNFGYHYFKKYKQAGQSYHNNQLEKEAEEKANRIYRNVYSSLIPACNTNGRATPNGQNRGDRLVSHTEMYEGDYLLSGDGRFKLVMQGDGNLVIYKQGRPIWASNTNGVDCTPYKLAMQSDGNLVIYGKNRPIWASNTNGNGAHPFSLVMQNDGNLVIYDPSRPTWASDTCCH